MTKVVQSETKEKERDRGTHLGVKYGKQLGRVGEQTTT